MPMNARNSMMNSKDMSRDRRQFLGTAKSAGLLGAAFALLGRGAAADAPSAAGQAAAAPHDGSYHETEHIRKYYASARFF